MKDILKMFTLLFIIALAAFALIAWWVQQILSPWS